MLFTGQQFVYAVLFTGQQFVYAVLFTGQQFVYAVLFTEQFVYAVFFTGQQFVYAVLFTGQQFVYTDSYKNALFLSLQIAIAILLIDSIHNLQTTAHKILYGVFFSGFSVSFCINEEKVTNLSLENNLPTF